MKRSYLLASAALLALALGSCSGPVQYRYYALASHPQTGSSPARLPVTLAIAPVEVAVAYDTVKLAYRVSPYELRYDLINTWVSKPGRVLQHVLYQAVEEAGTFETVTTGVSPPPDLRLDAYIAVLEEDVSGAAPVARLCVSLVLRDARSATVLMRQTLEGERELTEGGAEQTVAALSEILGAELTRVLPELAAAVPPPR